jgi:hypothetical protein
LYRGYQTAEVQQQRLKRALLVEQALVQQQQQTQEQLFQLQQTQQQLIQQHQQLLQQQQLLLQQQEKQHQVTVQQSVHNGHIPAVGRSHTDESTHGHETSSVQQAQAHVNADQQRDGRDSSRPLLQPHEQTLQHVINPQAQQAAHRPSSHPHPHYNPSVQVRDTLKMTLLGLFLAFICHPSVFHALKSF